MFLQKCSDFFDFCEVPPSKKLRIITQSTNGNPDKIWDFVIKKLEEKKAALTKKLDEKKKDLEGRIEIKKREQLKKTSEGNPQLPLFK